MFDIREYSTVAGKVSDNTANGSTTATIKNFGPSRVHIQTYLGSVADNGTYTDDPNSGYPLEMGESVTLPSAKFVTMSSSDATILGYSTIWVVFN